jgi:hypothetical protein
MSVNTSAAGVQPDYSQHQQRREAMKDLTNALNSNDLSSAQSAMQSLSQAWGNKTPKGPLGTDMAAVQQALSSGDLQGAQAAFAKVQQDMQAARAQHHGHKADNDQAAPQAAQGTDAASQAAAAQASVTEAVSAAAATGVNVVV